MDPKPPSGTVLVFRNHADEPIAVPNEVVTEAERAFRCHGLRLQGNSWEKIAELELYPSARSAKSDVDRYLEEGRALVVEASQREQLSMEVARFDALQLALWPAAMRGNVQSAVAVMNIIVHRARLVGLDPEKMNEDSRGPATLVIPVDGDGFLEALQQAAKKTEPKETPKENS